MSSSLFASGTGLPAPACGTKPLAVCEAACAEGDAPSCSRAADLVMRERARGPQRVAVAATMHDRACTLGFTPGCRELGRLLERGVSGTLKSDIDKAFDLQDRTCGAGDAAACAELGRMALSAPARAAVQWNGLELLERACEGGDGPGCRRLAHAVAFGQGTPVDAARARKLLQRGVTVSAAACDTGDLRACVQLGRALLEGEGTRPDGVRAAALLGRACEEGNPDGCHWLGVYHGRVATPDRALATALHRQACEEGSALGCQGLGDALVRGSGTRRDVAQGEALCHRACDASAEACDTVSARIDEGLASTAEPSTARRLHERACAAGSTRGCGRLALDTLRASSGPRAEAHAFQQLGAACHAGLVGACAQLGEAHAEGTGVPRDARRAASLWQIDCEAGVPHACQALGEATLEGRGVSADPARAQALLRKACDAGLPSSCTVLGYHRSMSAGASQSGSEATTWLERACREGDPLACTLAAATPEQRPALRKKFQRARECAWLVEGINRGVERIEASATASAEEASDAKGLRQLASAMEDSEREIGTLRLTDPTLLQHAAAYRTMARTIANVSRQVASGVEEGDPQRSLGGFAAVIEVLAGEGTLVDDINELCSPTP
ncbi:tetratricopeptide repeat protein [Chondromyces crocatus]|uniref:tetratricopeptide repeat protein n=1 Tax=Chondromyces crocatus TaxID=52 RepID=UPI001C54D49D|nr:tetratricopeptide repeat protein [Chondromyces crocatus]